LIRFRTIEEFKERIMATKKKKPAKKTAAKKSSAKKPVKKAHKKKPHKKSPGTTDSPALGF
jgi:hypothetical protein